MRQRFPAFKPATQEWELIVRGDSTDVNKVESFLRKHFSEESVLVYVSRGNGGLQPLEEAAKTVVAMLGKSEVRLANRGFTEFAVVGQPGVAAAWKVNAVATLGTGAVE
jgi:hypothetical protein